MNVRIQKRLAAAALLALLAGPVSLLPAREASAERLRAFGYERSCRGVSASTEWMQQARIGGLLLNLRLTTATGAGVTFMERLSDLEEEGMALELMASLWTDGLTLQFDQHALDVLTRVGVTKLVLADENREVRARYDVQELIAVRALLELGDREQLCIAGEDAPLMAINEDGVRRQVTR